MKILINNFAQFQKNIETATKEKFPSKYICQVCNSELELEEKDITTVPAKMVDKDETVNAKGFICPCCNSVNITG